MLTLDQSNPNGAALAAAAGYVQQNLHRRITLDEVAREVHFSSNYFCTLFKNATGMNLSRYINMARVERAQSLLATTHMPIVEVMGEVGFDDQSYFTNVFRRYAGVTPLEYRHWANTCAGGAPHSA